VVGASEKDLRAVRGYRTGGSETGMNENEVCQADGKGGQLREAFHHSYRKLTTEYTSLALRTNALRVVSTRPTALEEGGSEKDGEESREDDSLSKARGKIKHSQHRDWSHFSRGGRGRRFCTSP
jgi:hypothetical protein